MDSTVPMPDASETDFLCRLCSNRTYRNVAQIGRRGEPLLTVLCTKCGLVSTHPLPSRDQTHQFYRTRYRLEYKGRSFPDGRQIVRSGMRALDRIRYQESIGIKFCRVLDVGCGSGEFVYLMSKLGYSASGVEPDVHYSAFGREEYEIDVENCEFSEFENQNSPFDLITAHHVVEHLVDPLDFFARVSSMLAVGGSAIIEVPNVESRFHRPSRKWHTAHLFHFNSETLKACGVTAGLRPVATDFVGDCRHLRVLFQKSDIPRRTDLSENAKRVQVALRDHKELSHLCSLHALKRPFTNLKQSIDEWKFARKYSSPRQILDSLFESLGTNQTGRCQVKILDRPEEQIVAYRRTADSGCRNVV